MKYPLITKYLSKMVTWSSTTKPSDDWVHLETLELQLAKGVEVFGDSEDIRNAAFTTSKVEGVDTHSGLLLNYKPIESSKPVSREEIQRTLSESAPEYILEGLLKRILENGVK